MKKTMEENDQIVQDWTFTINEKRLELSKHFKLFRVINLIVLLLVLAVITVGFTILFPQGETGMGLAVAIIVAALIGVLIYSTLMKKYTTKKGNEYIALYYQKISDFIFGDMNIENYKQDVKDQLTYDDFYEAKLLKDVTSSGSRNLVKYHYNGHDIKLADYGAYRREGKQNQVLFVGKLIVVEGLNFGNNRVIIYRRPVQEQLSKSTGPTDIEGLSVVIDDSDILVYCEGDFDKSKFKEAINLIRKFPTSLPFVDASFSFIGQRLTIAISYTDDLMVIPLPEPFKKDATEVFKSNIEAIHKIIDVL